MEEGTFLIPWWIGSMWSTNYWVDQSLLILLIAPLIHGSRMIMLIYYIIGIRTKIIVVDGSHIVVHLRLLGNSDFCNPVKPISWGKVYGFHNLLNHILWTYTIYHHFSTIRYSKLCIDFFYHYRGLCKLGSQILKGYYLNGRVPALQAGDWWFNSYMP